MKTVCTSCGAQVALEAQRDFVRCPYCRAALVVEDGDGIRHFIVSSGLDESEARVRLTAALARQEISGVPEDVTVRLEHLPFWRISSGGLKDKLGAAFSPPCEDMVELAGPGGQEEYFDEAKAPKRMVPASIPLDEIEAGSRADSEGASHGQSKSSLVHLPFYAVDYRLGGIEHRAWVEAVSGEVYASSWPQGSTRERTATLALLAVGTASMFAAQTFFLEGWLLAASLPVTGVLFYLLGRITLRNRGW